MKIHVIKLNPEVDSAFARAMLQKDAAEKKCKSLEEKCAALEELVLLLKEELEEERYRHDRLQDFEVAESQQLAEAKAKLKQIRALTEEHFGKERKA